MTEEDVLFVAMVGDEPYLFGITDDLDLILVDPLLPIDELKALEEMGGQHHAILDTIDQWEIQPFRVISHDSEPLECVGRAITAWTRKMLDDHWFESLNDRELIHGDPLTEDEKKDVFDSVNVAMEYWDTFPQIKRGEQVIDDLSRAYDSIVDIADRKRGSYLLGLKTIVTAAFKHMQMMLGQEGEDAVRDRFIFASHLWGNYLSTKKRPHSEFLRYIIEHVSRCQREV